MARTWEVVFDFVNVGVVGILQTGSVQFRLLNQRKSAVVIAGETEYEGSSGRVIACSCAGISGEVIPEEAAEFLGIVVAWIVSCEQIAVFVKEYLIILFGPELKQLVDSPLSDQGVSILPLTNSHQQLRGG